MSSVDELEQAVENGRVQLERIATAVTTIYTQSLTAEARQLTEGDVDRLRRDVTDELKHVTDLLAALDEIDEKQGDAVTFR